MSLNRLIALPRSRTHQVILYKIYADLVAESERFFIGYLWWIIEPIIDMGVYYVVFAVLIGRGGPDFIPFLLVGILTWRWFQSSLTLGSNSILSNKGLMNQVYLPKIIFPIVSILTNSFKFAIAFTVLLGFLWIYGKPPGPYYAALPLILAVQFSLIFALTFLFSAFVPFYPDIRILLTHSLQVLFYLSGIFYSADRFSGKIKALFLMNPVAVLLISYRKVLMYNQWPDFRALGHDCRRLDGGNPDWGGHHPQERSNLSEGHGMTQGETTD